MAPKRKNHGANPRKTLFTGEALPDKDFDPMAESEVSQSREISISSNKTSASCDRNDLQRDSKRSSMGSFESSDDDNGSDKDNDVDSMEKQIY